METVSIKADVLKHDIPVDRAHVEALKPSLEAQGQLSPVLVREGDYQVIDGFHRITALQEMGVPEIRCTLISCSEQEFEDARIVSAVMHRGVSFSRTTLWVREQFLKTEWAGRLKASQAFRLGGVSNRTSNQNAFGKMQEVGIPPEELNAIVDWVKEKATVWGLSPATIANMLAITEQASPLLIPLVRERRKVREHILTRGMLKNLTKSITDHSVQEALAKKAIAEKMQDGEFQDLLEKIHHAKSEQLGELLTTPWLEQTKKGIRRAFDYTSHDWDSVKEKHNREVARMVVTMDKLASDIKYIGRDKDTVSRLDAALIRLAKVVAKWRGEDISELELLKKENAALTFQLRNTELQVEQLRQTIGIGQRMYVQDQVGD